MRFTALAALVFLMVSAFGQSQKLFSFSEGKQYNWWIAPQYTKAEYDNAKNLKLTLGKYPGHGEEYPRIYLGSGKLPFRDWSSWGVLAFHLDTPTGGKFWIKINDSEKRAVNLKFNLKPGSYEIRRNLLHFSNFNWKEVSSLEIAAERPAQDIVLRFGDFRLEPIQVPQPKNNMVKLSDFENGLDDWLVRSGTRFERAPWPDANTSVCAKLVFQKYSEKGEQWPAVILKTPYLYSDWSNAVSLDIEVESPTGGNIFLQFRAAGEHKNFNIKLPQGRSRLRIPAEFFPVKRNKMTELHIVAERPAHDIIVYMGEPVLHLADLSRTKEELSARIEKIRKEYGSLLPAGELEKCVKTVSSGSDIEKMTSAVDGLENSAQRSKLRKLRGERPFIAAWCSPVEKVQREKQIFHAFPEKTALIHAARGEGESAQLVILPARKLKNTTVKLAGPLRSSEGKTIPTDCVRIAPVGYIYCQEPVYRVQGARTGWRPDPILRHTREMDLEQEMYQPYLLDVNIPENQEPGTYHGEIAVRSGDAQQILPFTVQVHRFLLNRKLAYPTLVSFSLWELKLSPLTKNNQERWKKEAYRLMLENNMTPSDIYNAGIPLPAEDAKYMTDRGALCFNVMHVDYYHHKELPLIRKAMDSYRAAGVAEQALVYGFDERGKDYYGQLRDMALKIKQQNPGLKFATTTWDETFGADTVLKDAVDIWIPTTWRYESHSREIAEARKRGNQVWWYVAMEPHLPYANCFIENTAMQTRLLMGIMAWKYQPDGFLYWGAMQWKDNIRQPDGKWSRTFRKEYLKGAPLTDWPSYSFPGHNGDGNLLYPAEDGILESFRLKNMRDGMDDYIYLRMLEEAVRNVRAGSEKMSDSWLQKAEKELLVEKELLTSLTEYSANPDLLTAKRLRIAALLDEYNR